MSNKISKIVFSLILCMSIVFSNSALFSISASAATFANGADVSETSYMEAGGVHWYTRAGVQQDLFTILRNEGITSIRLRTWVNPDPSATNGYSGEWDMINLAVRAKNAGMRIMVDMHYSDKWADPSNQSPPRAWAGHTISQLQTDVTTYTTNLMNDLKGQGVTPEWVQVGNETNTGMLWPVGNANSSMANYALLHKAGYNAVKAVFPSAKVVVHLANGWDNGGYRWLFDGLRANGAVWDVIGMSNYPDFSGGDWQTLNQQVLANMNDMVARYGSEVLISETGIGTPDNPQRQKDYLNDLIAKVKSVSGGKGIGVFYWEPESINQWASINNGLFASNYTATFAFDAFGGGGGGGSYSIESTGTGFPIYADNYDYNLGTVFYTTRNGNINGLRVYTASGETGDHLCNLWNNNLNYLTSLGTWNYNGNNTWITKSISNVAITTGYDYTISISTGTDSTRKYPVDLGGFGSGGTFNNILYYTAGSGVYGPKGSSRPTTVYNNNNYLRDILFTPN